MKKLKLNKEIIANLQKEDMNVLKGGNSDRLCNTYYCPQVTRVCPIELPKPASTGAPCISFYCPTTSLVKCL